MIDITIDGKTCTCETGEYILDVAKRNDIEIPTLCHHPAVPGRGCCRVCIVDIEERNRHKIVTSCMYPIREKCAVLTNSDEVRKQRAYIISFLAKRAPHSEDIEKLAKRYNAPKIERIVGIDADKCILCGLCVKACSTIGTGAISEILRGTEKRVATPYDEPSVECIGCASCANVCPTGNIICEQTEKTRTIWHHAFELALCKNCGKPMTTIDELRYVAKISDTQMQELCSECREHQTAIELKSCILT